MCLASPKQEVDSKKVPNLEDSMKIGILALMLLKRPFKWLPAKKFGLSSFLKIQQA